MTLGAHRSLGRTPPPCTRRASLRTALACGACLLLILTVAERARAQDAPATTATWSAYFDVGIRSLGTAGDVNGDGVDDAIIGTPEWSEDGGGWMGQAGRAYVFLGHCGDGPSLTPDWFAQGATWLEDELCSPPPWPSGGRLGWQVGAAGDVNGDGFGDVFVLEHAWEESQGDPRHAACEPDPGGVLCDATCPSGRVHVWLGGPNGLPGTGSGSPAPSADWTWSGDDPLDAAIHVAAAGDVNGDGFDDLVIGSGSCCLTGDVRGRIRIFHGSSSGLSSAPSTVIDGENEDSTGLGHVVAGAGDVNGDGFADVLAMESGYRSGPSGLEPASSVHLYRGSSAGVHLVPVWTAEGVEPDSGFGSHLAGLGDIHGDGFADFLVRESAPQARAHIYRGGEAWPQQLPEASLPQPYWHDRPAGPAGDVNADGFADIVVSHDSDNVAHVHHGSPAGLAGSTMLRELNPEYTWAYYGTPTWTAGDVNGDGADDVLVAQEGWDPACGDPCFAKVWLYPGVPPEGAPPAPAKSAGGAPPCRSGPLLYVSDGSANWPDITATFVPKGCAIELGGACPTVWVVTTGPAAWGSTSANPTGVKARFGFEEVSRHPGIAMNAARSDRDHLERDFAFEPGTGCEEADPQDACTVPYMLDAVNNRSIATARLTITDWGASATVTARRVGTAGEGPLRRLRIPLDKGNGPLDEGNGLPDAGWQTWSLGGSLPVSPSEEESMSAGADLDDRPPGGHAGDGLTDFEEYRGFFIGGEHRRTHPRLKDIFVGNVPEPKEYALNSLMKLELGLHEVSEQDVRSPSMQINFMPTPGMGSVPQYAVFMVNGQCPCDETEFAFGCVTVRNAAGDGQMEDPARRCIGDGIPTRTAWRVHINRERIEQRTPPRLEAIGEDAVDESAIRKTYLHELGHAIGMNHYAYVDGPAGGAGRHTDCFPPYTAYCPNVPVRTPTECGPGSVMVSDFLFARMDCRPRERNPRPPGAPGGPPWDPCVLDAPCPEVNPATPKPYWVNMPLRTYGPFGRDHPTYDAIDRASIRLK